jgi:hypothetical protein
MIPVREGATERGCVDVTRLWPVAAAGTMVLAWVTSGTAVGLAAQQGSTVCTIVFDEVRSPGLRTAPSSGTLTSNGEGGLISCDGPVHGRQPTGAGSSGVSGRYGTRGADSCRTGGGGDEVQSMTIPTATGPERVVNTVTFTYGPMRGGVLTGQFQGDRMSGTFTARPYRVVHCGSTAMTKFRVDESGTFH